MRIRVRIRRGHAVAPLAAALVASVLALPGHATSGTVSCAALRGDAIHTRTMAQLASFVGWLRHYRVRGMVGELGWPDNTQGDGAEWNCLAQDYYTALDRYGLSAAAWSATEISTGNKLAIYKGLAPHLSMSQPNTQAAVLEAHPTTSRYLRGVSFSGSEDCFAQNPWQSPSECTANGYAGTDGVDYAYPSAAGLQYLAGRGIRLLVLPIRWERIQPQLYGALNSSELAGLRTAVNDARSLGMTVMIDLHNFGGYWQTTAGGQVEYALGSSQLPIGAFVDVWRRLSTVFRNESRVMYRLMNEPIIVAGSTYGQAARTNEAAEAAAVRAIRANHDGNWVAVDGFYWSSILYWSRFQPTPWIRDPLGRVIYDVHQYFDANYSATYTQTYDQENQQLGG